MLQTANPLRGMTAFRSNAMLAIAMFAVSPAVAHDPQEAFEMTVIRDAAYGSKVVAGKYGEAISKINALKKRPADEFFSSNNLCVAYTKSRDIDRAQQACDDAFTHAARERRFNSEHLDQANRKYKAMALSNRGVLRAISGDDAKARQDFREAMNLKAGISAPARNLARLDSRMAEILTSLQADH